MSAWSNAVNATQTGVQTINAGIWTGSALTDHAPLIGGASSAITSVGPLTNGQLVIGSTGVDPVAATLTQGSGITITNAAGSITIASTAAAAELVWTNNAPYDTATFAMAATVGAIASFAGAIAVTLPTSACAVGQLMGITVTNAAGIATITLGTGQTIQIGNATPYATSVSSQVIGDTLVLVCTVAASGSAGSWQAINVVGNWIGS